MKCSSPFGCQGCEAGRPGEFIVFLFFGFSGLKEFLRKAIPHKVYLKLVD